MSSGDIDMVGCDIDLDDLGLDTTTTTTNKPNPSRRFRPNSGKAKPKEEAKAESLPLVPKPEPNSNSFSSSSAAASGKELAVAENGGGEGDKMEVDVVVVEEEKKEDDEEDEVVREIDVFLNPKPLDDDTMLYVMQYPLRPCWRPYELDENCKEVRVKPKESKVEVDLRVKRSENYDQDSAGSSRLPKQTLSSCKVQYIGDCAVGVLRGNVITLNHIDAVVQLRPSLYYLDGNTPSRRKASQLKESDDDGADADEVDVDELTSPSTKKGKIDPEDSNKCPEDPETWISLDYHGMESSHSSKYHHQMVTHENGPIEFTMNPSDYVTSLCAGSTAVTKGPSRRELKLLPLEERMNKWFTEVSQVNRFNALMHLAPMNTEQEVLRVLQEYADLVRGLWVCKSSLLFQGVDALKRDAILLHFTKKDAIQSSQLEKMGVRVELAKRILKPLSVWRELFSDWKFRAPVDSSFIKHYPDIVKNQEHSWSTREHNIKDSLNRFGKVDSRKLKNSSNSIDSARVVDPNLHNESATDISQGNDISLQTQHLPEALKKIFEDKKVLSLQSVIRDLRILAVRLASNRKEKQKIQALINAARYGAFLPPGELAPVIQQVAVPIHDVYVFKPLEKMSFRNVLIYLFRKNPPKAKLKKQDIIKAGKQFLKRDVSDSEYNQAVEDFCIITEEGVALKSGD